MLIYEAINVSMLRNSSSMITSTVIFCNFPTVSDRGRICFQHEMAHCSINGIPPCIPPCWNGVWSGGIWRNNTPCPMCVLDSYPFLVFLFRNLSNWLLYKAAWSWGTKPQAKPGRSTVSSSQMCLAPPDQWCLAFCRRFGQFYKSWRMQLWNGHVCIYMGVSENSGFYPQIIHLNRVFHCKPSILGYHYFRKHPYILYIYCTFMLMNLIYLSFMRFKNAEYIIQYL